ncbi:hypothetical protein BGZ57DRAFT_763438, partial [Hyaloscypha finlandica]
ILNSYKYYKYSEITLNYLSYLTKRLKVNLINLPRPNLSRELIKRNILVVSIDYITTF